MTEHHAPGPSSSGGPSAEALAAENARLRRAVEELSVLNEAAAALGRSADLGTAVEALVHRALAAVAAEEGIIVLVGPPLGEGDPSPATFVRSVATAAEPEGFHPSASLVGWVQRYARPLVVNDPAGDGRFRAAEWPDDVRNVLSVPLFASGRLTGVFTLYNKRGPGAGAGRAEGPAAFTDDDVRLLSILAGQSAQAVERMRLAAERERALRLFGQHTAPQVVEALMARAGDLPVRRQDVAVMFLDLRGFTLRSEAWAPEAVVEYLNCLFDTAISAVVAHGGVVHQLLGDGLMALFGFPTPSEDAPRHAVEAALEIVGAVDEACAAGRLAETELGIGLHAGEAVVGPVGSAAHREYKVTGDVVNVTARIEKLCKTLDARVLVSGPLYDRLGPAAPPGAALGEVPLDGRREPVSVVRLA